MEEQLMAVIRQMIASHITFGTTGNLSVLDSDRRTLLITPSGMAWDGLTGRDLVTVDVATGESPQGSRRPSSELPLHLAIYRGRHDVSAVAHVHSRYATVFSTLNRPVKAVHYQLAEVQDEVPIADYATYGTESLAQKCLSALGQQGHAVLLKNHGLVTVGPTIEAAYRFTRDVEWVAEIYFHALLIGEPDVLTHQELEAVRGQLRHYGQTSRDE